jgi:hypothetical protein
MRTLILSLILLGICAVAHIVNVVVAIKILQVETHR